MCFKAIGEKFPSFLAPSKGPANTGNAVSNLIFSNEIDNYFITQDNSDNFEKKETLLPKDRCIEILNKIASTKSGYDILNGLKTKLDELQPAKKILFVQKQKYEFVSEAALSSNVDFFVVNVASKRILERRYIFDGNRVETHTFPADKKSEAYFIAHELTHVVSFLNSGVTDENDWANRKTTDAGWVDFFNETDKMQEVYHGLLLDGFTPKQIIETFKTFFYNTEEARNVLGLVKGTVDGQETLIGEGAMFKKQNHFDGIVTYLNESRQPNAIEQAILRRLTDDRYSRRIKPMKQDAVTVLGPQFIGFNLVNVPRENSAIEAIKKTGAKFLGQGKRTDQNNYDDSHLLYSPWYGCLEYEVARLQDLKQNALIDEITKISGSIENPIILIQADEKQPDSYTFIQFNPDKSQNKILDENQNLLNIKNQNPNAVFIYYNGVNHFQALVP